MPKAIRTTPAARPAHSRILLVFIAPPPDGSVVMAVPSRRRGRAPSGIGHRSAARKPPPGCGEVRRARLPGLRAHDRLRHADTDAGVDRDRAVGQREHRVEVELGDGGKLLSQPRETVYEVEQRSAVGRGRAPEARYESPRLAAVDELGRVDVRQRGDPEDRLADQLREDAAGTEGDERPEDGVLDD